MAVTVEKQQGSDLRGVSSFLLFSIFLGTKNRGSMDPVQRGGPWTWGPGFVISRYKTPTKLMKRTEMIMNIKVYVTE